MIIGLVLNQPPGYSETFFNSKIKSLKENGHEVVLFTGPGSHNYKGCEHRKTPKVSKFFLIQLFNMFLAGCQLLSHTKAVRTYFKLERNQGHTTLRVIEKIYLNSQLLRFKGDWIHFGFATLALGREMIPKAVGAKFGVSFRGYDINVYPLKQPNCYDLLWQQVDKVHSISRFLLNKAYDLGLDADKPFRIIHPAVDVECLPQVKMDQQRSKFRIVTIARFGWIKGLELLTEVAGNLKKLEVDFEWTLIGTGSPAEKERFLYEVSEKELQNHVFNVGKISHIETLKILSECDIYVQTSLSEGFCNAMLEAQALGLPCVAFKVGGIPENVVDGKTGWLIEPYECETMTKTIINVSRLSTIEKAKISEQAMKRVREHFNLEQQRKAFHEFYML